MRCSGQIRPGSPIGVAMSELSPPDTRGVRQAGDIGSMLSSEALLLLGENETLKMLFYSKLIERSLLSYDRYSNNDSLVMQQRSRVL